MFNEEFVPSIYGGDAAQRAEYPLPSEFLIERIEVPFLRGLKNGEATSSV